MRLKSSIVLTHTLGPTHPGSINVRPEPFSTSVITAFNWFTATTTKIHTRSRFRNSHEFTFQSASIPTYTATISCRRIDFRQRIECYPFSGLIHSAGELLHTPYRISTSMTTVLLSQWINTFYVCCELSLNSLFDFEAHPSSPDLLTKHGPLEKNIRITSHLRRFLFIPIQSLRIGRESEDSRHLLSLLYQEQLYNFPAILRETSEGTSY